MSNSQHAVICFCSKYTGVEFTHPDLSTNYVSPTVTGCFQYTIHQLCKSHGHRLFSVYNTVSMKIVYTSEC